MKDIPKFNPENYDLKLLHLNIQSLLSNQGLLIELLTDLRRNKLNIDLVEAWYSLEQYIGLKEDKLSSTTVDFIRSEWNLETKHLILV